jgi:heat shock protein HtpX
MKRIVLFILTNLAVMLVMSITLSVLGVGKVTGPGGLNLSALLVLSLVMGFTGSIISLLMSKLMAKWSTGAHVITAPQNATEQWLVNTVQRQAQQAGIGMPEVAIYDSPEINAFATGWSKNNSLVAVSTGLMNNMSADEAEAVLAHEVSHVANGDMVTLTLVQGVVNTFVIFLSRVIGYVVDRMVLKNERGDGIGFMVTSLVAQLVLGIFASMIVMWFSRYREFHADAGGAKLAGKHKMIAALERLKMNHEESALPKSVAAFGISGGGAFSKLFMTHPPLDERIEALRRAA